MFDDKETRYRNQQQGKSINLFGALMLCFSFFMPFIMDSFWEGLFWGVVMFFGSIIFLALGPMIEWWNKRS